jgi:DNA-binding CsgD family transcriptional regulator
MRAAKSLPPWPRQIPDQSRIQPRPAGAGLTQAELRVLLSIVEIGGVAEVAEVLGIAETTVKTHLRHVFEKTSTSRQADLVKLVAGYSRTP